MADIVTIHGRRGCACMRDSLPMIEDRLRKAGIIKKDLSGLISQGGFNRGGVAASAGTHDGGGVFDLRGSIANQRTARVLRECGLAAWVRTPAQSNWPLHIHAVWNGCPHVSAGARRQVASWKSGRNGLASNGRDDGPRVAIKTWKQALNDWKQTVAAKPDSTGGFKPVTPQPKPKEEEDEVPKVIEKTYEFQHGGGGFQIAEPFYKASKPIKAMDLHAVVHGPEGARLITRWVAFVRPKGRDAFWDRRAETIHSTHRAETDHAGFTVDDNVELYLDVASFTKGAKFWVSVTGLIWE